jgi:hypothetical protein
VDFTGYTPPGVYVEDESSPIVTSAGSPSGLVCIVGPACGYQTDIETLPFTLGTDVFTLRQRGIITSEVTGPPAITAPVVTKAGRELPFVEGDDYILDILNTESGGPSNNFVTITRVNEGQIAFNDEVVISYNYADLSYYSPQIFQDYDTLTSVYGNPFDLSATTPAINSHVSVAARVAFSNGATQIMVVPADPSVRTYQEQLVDAYNKIESDYRVSVLVPLLIDGYTTDNGDDGGPFTSDTKNLSAFINDIKSHLTSTEANGYGRIAIIGGPTNLTQEYVGDNSIALDSSSKRIVAAYPNRLNLSVDSGKTLEVGGYYLAVAYGALLVSGKVNRGLTKRQISGFYSFPQSIIQEMTTAFKDSLSKNGVSVTELDRLSRKTVRHGVTTDMSALNYREISLVRTADTLYQMLYTGIEAADLIGQPITLDTTLSIKGIVSGILERAKGDETIIDWQNLLVRQQATPLGDPTVIEVKFAYRPAVPLNYISVKFKIDLNSGSVTTTAV